MTPKERASKFLSLVHSGDDINIVEAAKLILTQNTEKAVECVTVDKAKNYIQCLVLSLLNQGKYLEAAKILWPPDIFTSKPKSVARIWNKLPSDSKVFIHGCGSAGKSYTLAAWLLLDWWRDPDMTCIKVLSVTSEHAQRNVFAHIKRLKSITCIPMPGICKANSITTNEDEKQGIHLSAVPQGEDGSGRLRGFHPVPRVKEHPIFGKLSRVRAILDEAEEIPGGVWEDIDNMLITQDGVEHVKVFAATNPKDRASKFGQLSEPKEGWASIGIEESQEWISKYGWKVIRIDGASMENVVERRVVFPGFLTYKGYTDFLAYGADSPTFQTMGRGWFPQQGTAFSVLSGDYIQRARGEFIFTGKTTFCAAVDFACEGGDALIMTIGRFGFAVGHTPMLGTPNMFKAPRWALQIDHQIELEKQSSSIPMCEDIIKKCKMFDIPHNMLCIDRTGNGSVAHDYIKMVFGPDVLGINYGEAATDRKILDDDAKKANELYDGIVTELFFRVRKWIEFDYLKFGPSLELKDLSNELTGRMFKESTQGRVRLEKKKDYKARGNKSPDRADSLTLLCALVAARSDFVASILAQKPEQREQKPVNSIVDTREYIDFGTD